MERFQHKRSLGKEKPYHGCSAKIRSFSDQNPGTYLVLTERVLNQGNVQNEKLVDTLKVASDSSSCSSVLLEEGLHALELRCNSLKQAGGTPMKKLLAEELSKEVESRRRTPSVIARLMGLDALPSPHPVHKQQKKFSQTYLQRRASIGSNEKTPPYEAPSLRLGTNDQQEFKDVFEVLEASKVAKKTNLIFQKEKAHVKQRDEKMALIRENFMDAKRLSTDEKLQHSMEFQDALEVLDSNKDLLLKFLQEPDSLFTKHLHDLQSVPPAQLSAHVTILKPSNAPKHGKSDLFRKPEKKTEQRNAIDSHHRHDKVDVNYCNNRHSVYNSYKLSNSRHEGKDETCLLPTRIVVLKPNLGKVPNTTGSLSSACSSGGLQPNYRQHKEVRDYGNCDLISEVHERKNSSSDVEHTRHRTRRSMEIAKEITRQMRDNVSNSSLKVPSSVLRGYAGDESPYSMSGNDSENDSEVVTPTSRYSHQCKERSSLSPSSSYSTESSVTREAKKRLSERWKMTRRFQEVGLVSKGSTLGEMLAMSDKETRSMTLTSEDWFRSDGFARCNSPLGISSRDGWKDVCNRSLPRSRSVPTSSTAFGSPSLSTRGESIGNEDGFLMLRDTVNQESYRSRKVSSIKKVNSLPRNLRCSSKKSQHSLATNGEMSHAIQESQSLVEPRNNLEVAEQNPMAPGPLAANITDKRLVVEWVAVADSESSSMPSNTAEEMEQLSKPFNCVISEKEADFSSHDPKETIPESHKESLLPAQCPVPEPESPASSKGVEQPSPISVLEPPFAEETTSGSECFEQISADLHGLRLQLQLLKLESSDTYEGLEVAVSSDEETGEGSFGVMGLEEIAVKFRIEENKCFSYLVDMLLDSDLYLRDVDRELALSTWYSSECPVSPLVFEKLEKKYDEQTWLRSDRRLLFDRINEGLMEIFGPQIDPHPWVKSSIKMVCLGWGRESLVEELWKWLVCQERDVSVDSPEKILGRDVCLELGDDIEVVGTEIERLLFDELIGESVQRNPRPGLF
ncbi:PREDICTED: uncharacterized protein LOC104594654 isoform X2 [Nelumbo nucifera]|uniref:Uncharacterized protein LOC104594654 isoform X2 n=1 Tax=Nelumbo nucifera TaxID=4432 RepID=A0A1U7ZHN1_NELNU|nr:PREDICTED: uncharacterized protein LOC104594654 isoform X2 [Nelumbo nucifera]